jgi:hypothetical protein
MKKLSLIEKNMKIHNNLWKIYSSTLFVGVLLVFFQGYN